MCSYSGTACVYNNKDTHLQIYFLCFGPLPHLLGNFYKPKTNIQIYRFEPNVLPSLIQVHLNFSGSFKGHQVFNMFTVQRPKFHTDKTVSTGLNLFTIYSQKSLHRSISVFIYVKDKDKLCKPKQEIAGLIFPP